MNKGIISIGNVDRIFPENNKYQTLKIKLKDKNQFLFLRAYEDNMRLLQGLETGQAVEVEYNHDVNSDIRFINRILKLNEDYTSPNNILPVNTISPYTKLQLISKKELRIKQIEEENERWMNMTPIEKTQFCIDKWKNDTREKIYLECEGIELFKFKNEDGTCENDGEWKTETGDRYHYYSTTNKLLKFKYH